MNLPECTELLLDLADSTLYITLNRPEKRNAMNSILVEELIAVVDCLVENRRIRVLVLRGAEGNFCAGGDISGMNKKSTAQDEQSNVCDDTWHFNRLFGELITKVNYAPQIVVTLLEGAVLGGGLGLACVADVAIAERNAKFAMPETGLGIIPAQIAPFVVARIGLTQTRRLALLGERIDGRAAQKLGIAHYLVEGVEGMQQQLEQVLKMAKRCAPSATAATKKLLHESTSEQNLSTLLDRAADDFSAAMTSKEGQEGTRAFIEKRKPKWAD